METQISQVSRMNILLINFWALRSADFRRLCVSPRATSRAIVSSISNSFGVNNLFQFFLVHWEEGRCSCTFNQSYCLRFLDQLSHHLRQAEQRMQIFFSSCKCKLIVIVNSSAKW